MGGGSPAAVGSGTGALRWEGEWGAKPPTIAGGLRGAAPQDAGALGGGSPPGRFRERERERESGAAKE